MAITRISYQKHQDKVPVTVNESSFNGLLKWTLWALVGAALAEVLIWRAFSRIGVFIPKDDPKMAGFKAFYEGSVKVGEVLRNFAVVLAFVALILLIMRLRQSGILGFVRRKATVSVSLTVGIVATLLVFGLTGALLGLVESDLGSLLLRLAMLTAFGSFSLYYWQRYFDWLERSFIALLFIGYLLPNLAKILHDNVFAILNIDGTRYVFEPLMEAGELIVVVNAVLLFALYVRHQNINGNWWAIVGRHRLAFGGAIVLTGLFIGLTFLTVAESFIVPILALYVLGYAMHWPLPLYVIGLFLFLFTIFSCVGQARHNVLMRAEALGLTLIFLGGYSFNISDQYLFALVGLLLLVRPELSEWS